MQVYIEKPKWETVGQKLVTVFGGSGAIFALQHTGNLTAFYTSISTSLFYHNYKYVSYEMYNTLFRWTRPPAVGTHYINIVLWTFLKRCDVVSKNIHPIFICRIPRWSSQISQEQQKCRIVFCSVDCSVYILSAYSYVMRWIIIWYFNQNFFLTM